MKYIDIEKKENRLKDCNVRFYSKKSTPRQVADD